MSDYFKIPNHKDAPLGSRYVLRWIYFFLKPYRVKMAGFMLLRYIRFLFFSLTPLYLALAIEHVETGRAFEDPTFIWQGLAGYAVVSFIVYLGLMVISRDHMLFDKVSRGFTLFSVRHLLHLSPSWHEDKGSAGKFQQVLVARNAFNRLYDLCVWDTLYFIAVLSSVVVSIIAMDIPLYFVGLYALFFITYFIVSIVSAQKLKGLIDTHNETFEHICSSVYEFVDSIKTVKILGLDRRILSIGLEKEREGAAAFDKQTAYSYGRWVVINSSALFWIILISSLAYQQALDQTLSVAAFALVGFLTFRLWDYFESVTRIYTQFIEHSNGMLRLIDTLNVVPDIVDAPGATPLVIEKGQVTFEGVNFSYIKDTPILNEVSLAIKPGQKIGLVGHSGAGKSTLISTLLRFYDVPSGAGSIQIDGQNIQSVTLESLRAAMAVIPQDVTMFNHSIMDNIRYGRLDASDADVIVAAKKAEAHGFIEALPQGYETLVGERGLKLSGGQRQRIAIARAILKDAPILILDEATSALDSASEYKIQKTLETVMQDKTVIAIAHRLSTLAQMDRIVVMEAGRVVQDGTHKELLKTAGIYKDLWQMQSDGFIA